MTRNLKNTTESLKNENENKFVDVFYSLTTHSKTLTFKLKRTMNKL